MRVLVIENFVGTPLGLVGDGARRGRRRRSTSAAPITASRSRTSHDGYDGLVVLGGGAERPRR